MIIHASMRCFCGNWIFFFWLGPGLCFPWSGFWAVAFCGVHEMIPDLGGVGAGVGVGMAVGGREAIGLRVGKSPRPRAPSSCVIGRLLWSIWGMELCPTSRMTMEMLCIRKTLGRSPVVWVRGFPKGACLHLCIPIRTRTGGGPPSGRLGCLGCLGRVEKTVKSSLGCSGHHPVWTWPARGTAVMIQCMCRINTIPIFIHTHVYVDTDISIRHFAWILAALIDFASSCRGCCR